mgnify:CR=1 FL=1
MATKKKAAKPAAKKSAPKAAKWGVMEHVFHFLGMEIELLLDLHLELRGYQFRMAGKS